jgi:glyoxylase-like metal-dependent hydrolase (beta-lactamase superfamily II)
MAAAIERKSFAMTPPDDFDPVIGFAETLEPGLRRIVAPNPSPMTYRGTNTYLLGDTEIAVIDPGPDSTTHLEAILGSIQPNQRISHIIVTHSHLDHSPLSRPLADRCGAPILAFGGAKAGRSAVMDELSKSGLVGGGEGIDVDFTPDQTLSDGEIINGDDWTLKVIHTPGHLGNHISLAWNDACFTADHVMGWASSLVSPPDGDLTDFMASCTQLQQRPWRVFYAGHGDVINDPTSRLEWLVGHRKARETAILLHLADGPANATALAHVIYTETPIALRGAATRNVLAHLVDLKGKGRVSALGNLSENVEFVLNKPT